MERPKDFEKTIGVVKELHSNKDKTPLMEQMFNMAKESILEAADEIIPPPIKIPTLKSVLPKASPLATTIYEHMAMGHSLVVAALASGVSQSKLSKLREDDPILDEAVELGQMAQRAHWENICNRQAVGITMGNPTQTLQIMKAIGEGAGLKESKATEDVGSLSLQVAQKVVEPSTFGKGTKE